MPIIVIVTNHTMPLCWNKLPYALVVFKKKKIGTPDIVSLQRGIKTVCSRVMLKVTGHCDPQSSALGYEQCLEV